MHNYNYTRCLKIICGVFGALLMANVAHAEMPAGLKQLLARNKIPQSAVSIEVREMSPAAATARAPILSINANRARNPASTIKLLTTLAALELLKPNYVWRSEYLAAGKLNFAAKELDGDLIFRGGGDPLLTLEQLFAQIINLQRNIKDVRGDLIIDNSKFGESNHDPAAFDGQAHRLYNIAADAALFNFSATTFNIKPHANKIYVTATPPLAGLKIINKLKSHGGRCRSGGWYYSVKKQGDELLATFSGSYRKRCGEKSFGRSITSNVDYACRLFLSLWRNAGGSINGCRVTNDANQFEHAQSILIQDSKPLSEAIKGINKFSNNSMAKILLLTLGELAWAGDGHSEMPTREKLRAAGSAQIDKWRRENNIDMPKLKIDNGAGLSRSSRMSVYGLAELLEHGWRSIYRPEFMASLPLAGMDGSMKTRLKKTPLAGRARIKTGLVNGVRSMAGFVHSGDRHYGVAMIIDSPRVNFHNGNAMQDQLLKWVYQQ